MTILLPVASLLLIAATFAGAASDSSQTGPETEKRFPALQVPPGFKATLFACDPLIEYPSAIALGPKPGSIFVAIDYMTGLGTEIIRRDEIRLVQDTDGDGYADRVTVYATGFNSIEGLTFHDGVVYAMHSPLLTALRDVDGDGVADERRDLLSGLGLAPEDNPPRLHCANGIVWGYDGWLYLALGDHGCDVLRPEGDRLVFRGGGVLRCRTDGRDLHEFSTGLRNIYDVALDEDLNVFVRDNENDGGEYKIRVCHSFFGANHGYPYLYNERPDEALPPLADLGLGSSAGGVAYLENQFPAEYRGNLFFCEWGRAVVRYIPVRSGAGFAPVKEIEFASGAANDPYGFKPTDLVVERDGSLMVSDWADGQRPKRGRGRIYRISFVNADEVGSAPKPDTDVGQRSLVELVEQLDLASYAKRIEAHTEIERRGDAGLAAIRAAVREGRVGLHGQLHAVWIFARANADVNQLIQLASQRDALDSRVQVQAIRALTDLNDPVLLTHRLDGISSDERIRQPIPSFLASEPTVRLEQIISSARLRSASLNLVESKISGSEHDTTLAHSAQQTLRRVPNGYALLTELDRRANEPIRLVTLRALTDRAEPELVDGLIERLHRDPDPTRQLQYADLLARVYKKPGPWTYWGYRPPPRPPNTVEWERTARIQDALNDTLLARDRSVRLAVLRKMQREKIPTAPGTVQAWLADDRDPERVGAILSSLRDYDASVAREMLLGVVREPAHTDPNRLVAFSQLVGKLDERSEECLVPLAAELADGPVLAAVLEQIASRPKLMAGRLFIPRLNSPSAEVRAAAVRGLGELGSGGASGLVAERLSDVDPRVRRQAALAAAKFDVPSSRDRLLKLASDPDGTVRAASLHSLRLLSDPRAIAQAVSGLRASETQQVALEYIGQFGSPEHASLVVDAARRNPSAEALRQVAAMFDRWGNAAEPSPAIHSELDRALAELQGASGTCLRWYTRGPMSEKMTLQIRDAAAHAPRQFDAALARDWKSQLAGPSDSNFSIRFARSEKAPTAPFWLGISDVSVTENTHVQFFASSDSKFRVWLNGEAIYERSKAAPLLPDSDRFHGKLVAGLNRLVVQLEASQAPVIHVRFRRKSSRAEHEQLVQAALTGSGNADRGGKIFFDAEKSRCIKCHRLGERGERIAPELTGVGNRFSRIHIVESILEPSRTLAPSYESVTVAMNDGRILTGLRVAESDSVLTLVDNQAVQHLVDKSAIGELRVQATSIMPEGLEKQLTVDEFVDLVAFLVSQKKPE